MSHRVIGLLRSRLASVTEGSSEFGGLLLGRAECDAVVIDGYEPVESEYRYGPNFVLSPRDRDRLQRQMRRLGGRVAGVFRSHARRGLYLDTRDFALFQRFFPDPRSVFLLARHGDPAGRAGFFVWDEGDVQRHASPLEFSLAEAAPVDADPPLPQPLLPAGGQKSARSHRWLRTAAFAAALAAVPVISYETVRLIASHRSATAVQPGLASRFVLKAKQVGDSLELRWNGSDPLVRRADHGHLLITDGAAHDQVWLSSAGLKAGRFVYIPTTHTVDFRLELYSMLRHQEIGAAVQDVVGVRSEAARRDTGEADRRPVAAARRPHTAPVPKQRRSGTRPGQDDRPARIAPARFERLASAGTAMVLAAPAPVPVPPVSAGPPLSQRIEIPQPSRTATVTSEPVPPSRWREMLRRVPGLRALSRWRDKRQPSFVPARPISREALVVPPDFSLAQPETVHVLARIEPDGRVSDVQYDDGADQRLGELAANAVSRWRFSPARVNDAPVASELLLHFKFPAVSR